VRYCRGTCLGNIEAIEYTSPRAGFELTTVVVIGDTDCMGSYKSNYHNKGNNKITELRTIFQRESQNS